MIFTSSYTTLFVFHNVWPTRQGKGSAVPSANSLLLDDLTLSLPCPSCKCCGLYLSFNWRPCPTSYSVSFHTLLSSIITYSKIIYPVSPVSLSFFCTTITCSQIIKVLSSLLYCPSIVCLQHSNGAGHRGPGEGGELWRGACPTDYLDHGTLF